MPIHNFHFWWQPNNSPVGATANRVDIGLQLGGDDDRISTEAAGTDGRVLLYEVGGSGAARGPSESSDPRLLARFHGKFHRIASGPQQTRITFEINTGASAPTNPYAGKVQGFDPECFIGVDAFVFTFVNREFRVNLPFFLDTRSEGTFMEVQAVAEVGDAQSPTRIGQSAILNMRIRRQHEVSTTTQAPGGGGSMSYTGNLIGNLILHHEQYLVQGSYRNTSTPWPSSVSARYVEIPWTGSYSVPFQSYSSGGLSIVLMNDLLDGLMPDDSYLQSSITGVTSAQQAGSQVRTRFRDSMRSTITDLFTDAGFTSPNVRWQDETAASQMVTAFTGAFVATGPPSSRHWALRSGHTHLSASFWAFYVVRDSTLSAVGEAERPLCDQLVTAGSREYLLPYPSPIGSGNKKIEAPIRVASGYFRDRLTRTTDRRGNEVDRQYASMQDFLGAAGAIAAKVGIVIAHEIGHSIGLMHEALILNSGAYSERSGSPVLTVMSSSTESSTYGTNMKFSHQAKVMWERAFGVSPNWDCSYLANKTWGNDWATVDWATRLNRFCRQYNEVAMGEVGLGHDGAPPYAGTPPNAQRGTYVPPQP